MYSNNYLNQFVLGNSNQNECQGSYTNKMNSKIVNQNTTPITVTWNVNAYVKNKNRFLKRLKNSVETYVQDQHFDNNLNDYSHVEPIDETYKHILKNGLFSF